MARDIISEALEGNDSRFNRGEKESLGESLPAITVEKSVVAVKGIENIDTKQDIKDDYTYAREIMLASLAQSQELIKGMTHFINMEPSPRAYEVINQMIKTSAENAQSLIDLQQKLKDVQKEEAAKGTATGDKTSIYVIGGPLDILDNAIDITKQINDQQ